MARTAKRLTMATGTRAYRRGLSMTGSHPMIGRRNGEVKAKVVALHGVRARR
jgi:hypothetical protein